MATIKDVAKLANVGVGTVSRYMSGGSVSEKRAAAIKQAMLNLEYRPNSMARSLSRQRSDLIGVYLPSLSGPFYHKILRAIETQLREQGKHLILANAEGSLNDEQQLAHLEYLLERDCDAVLMACPSVSDNALLATIDKHPNVVLINRELKGYADKCFSVDHYLGGKIAAQNLVRLGHRSFAMVTGRLSAQDAQRRQQGFIETLIELGCSIDSDLVIEGSFNYEPGAKAIKSILKQRSRFSALFCGNDKLAQVALSQLYDLDLGVPSDMAVVGYDDVDFCAYTAPALSTIHIPIEAMATAACRKVLNSAYGLDMAFETQFQPEFIQRSST
ncbi:LacI family transcriptional regulator [Alginatibacterium sediminis]|uniref:LacI family transcriptional regulator n=1 Tax=Alginatibacterium sediminis TaxID=2164068 RepID=A0A420ED92_9ALTE|nr:LacI family DNA-binding transcriptional regulator [Alginatibacterium sediminis]RKF18640.1 LacI family transcriptional regulator [Alginatibacterium sediminis]